MKVAIRTDASRDIGTGHVVRCRTLALELRRCDVEIRFLCRTHEGNLIDLLRVDGFAVSALPPTEAVSLAAQDDDYSAWLGVSQDQDVAHTVEALAGWRPDWMIVDHYGLDIAWETALRGHVGRLMVIDDLANRSHDCDMLLDQNYAIEPEKRYLGLIPPGCRLLLGPHYALLHAEYARRRVELARRDGVVRNVLVFFGGTDAADATGLALDAMSSPDLVGIHLDLIAGRNYPNRALLAERAAKRGNAIVRGPLPNLVDAMADADLAIGAGGGTSWERLCLGLPSVIVSIADNQRPACEALAHDGLAVYAGHVNELAPRRMDGMLRELIADRGRVSGISDAGKKLVDGQGTPRVVRAVMEQAGAAGVPPGETLPRLSVISDASSWMNRFIEEWVAHWRDRSYAVQWRHDVSEIKGGDICFYLSCSQIVPRAVRERFGSNLVVHESDLPKGRGWSPMTWQILEGALRIPVTLFEAKDQVDSGRIYAQTWIELRGDELVEEWRRLQAKATFELCRRFLDSYPQVLDQGREQTGEQSFFRRRVLEDSRLDPDKTLADQFDLLRVVDNDRYPAFFDLRGHRYIVRIEKQDRSDS